MAIAIFRRPRWGLALLATAQVLLLLSGCGGTPTRPPKDPGTKGDYANVPDAVPKWEPRSKYGNPDYYEVFGRRYRVMNSANGFVERGVASWYGPNFHGKRTSSGEQYDMYAMTAAHKTLPLPTYARVTNLQNGRSIVVKINDRGPFKDERVIDLSYVAAHKLGVAGPGTAPVEVRAITPGQDEPATLMAANEATPSGPGVTAAPAVIETTAGAKPLPMEPLVEPAPVSAAARPEVSDHMTVYLQAGAFANRANAEKLRNKLAKALAQPVMIQPFKQGDTTLHRVRLGPFASFEDADRYAVDMNVRGLERPRVAIEH